jgi:hypothetical protein
MRKSDFAAAKPPGPAPMTATFSTGLALMADAILR